MARPPRPPGHRRVRETAQAGYTPAPSPEGIAGILLDSDVVIDVLRGDRLVVAALRAVERRAVPTYCCAVSLAEIFAGLRTGEEVAAEAFFTARGDVVIDAAAGRRAGAYLSRYGRSHGVEIADALIAAAASSAGLHLWSRNRRHYPMPDLRFFDPPPA